MSAPILASAHALPDDRAHGAFYRRLRLSLSGWIGCGIIAVFVLLALGADWIAPYDPNQLHPAALQAAPSPRFLLGTDHLGRDVLSRLLFAARISLSAAVLAAIPIVVVPFTVSTTTLSATFGPRPKVVRPQARSCARHAKSAYHARF